MQKTILVAVLIFALLANFAASQELSQLKIELQIEADGTASGIISGAGGGMQEVKLSLPFEPNDLKTADQISVQKNLLVIKNSSSFSASFDTEKITSAVEGDAKQLSLIFAPGFSIDDFSLKISLPNGAAIVDKNGLLVTRPVSISTDGQKIFLVWQRRNFSEETFFVQYRADSGGLEFGILHIALIVIIVLAAGIFGGIKYKRFKKEKFIQEILGPEEKKVVAEIKKSGGEILQENLRHKFGWSKTKSSKLVARLESKGVVEKKVYGKTNRLKLK